MNLLTRVQLDELINTENQNCISFYLPMEKAPTEADKTKVLFKNQIKAVESELIEHGIAQKNVDSLISPAVKLLETPEFWTSPDESAAVFVAGSNITTIKLPFPIEPTTFIGPKFYLVPLFKLFSFDSRFYILALSQNKVRLLNCDLLDCAEVDITSLPTSLDEALQYDDIEKKNQYVMRSPGSTGDGGPGVYRGQGDGKDEHKTNIWRFMEMLDSGLSSFIKDKDTPVVLAGVEFLTAIFRKANSHLHLIDKEISGNTDILSEKQLHEKAYPLAQEFFDKFVASDLELYHNLSSSDKTGDTIEEIASAAAKGKIRILFATQGMFIPGMYNVELDSAFHKDHNPDSEDLINFAAVNTFKAGGKVYVLDRNQMPDTENCAAIFRY
jgi:hypothetical protein